MEIAFVTNMDMHDKSGGARASEHNFESLKCAFGAEHVHFFKAQYMPNDTRIHKLHRYACILFRETEYTNIIPQLKDFLTYDLVFLDTSHLSFVAKWLKRHHFQGKICTYVHNCEYDFVKGMLKPYHDGPVKRLMLWHAQRNERNAIRYSDLMLFINNRDHERMEQLYGAFSTPWKACPIALKDKMKSTPEEVNAIKRDTKIITFVGTFFGPNIEGIKWFITQVLPDIHAELHIVGRGMNGLSKIIDTNGIKIYSDVEDLTPYFLESDYMIFPIFDGSGMKIKTCESLMYAKNIIGTPEAFSGYGIEDYSKVGACCKTAKDFISAIDRLEMPRYNHYSRTHFLQHFSFDQSVNLYRNLLAK